MNEEEGGRAKPHSSECRHMGMRLYASSIGDKLYWNRESGREKGERGFEINSLKSLEVSNHLNKITNSPGEC